MPRTTTVECHGCPPLRALTFDTLGLIKVVEARDKQQGGLPKIVEIWGEPDSSKSVMAVSMIPRNTQPLMAVARKNGHIEVMCPVSGDLQATISNANGSELQSEENNIVGLHLFAKQNLEVASRSCTLLTCTTKGNACIRSIEATDSSTESSCNDSSKTWNICSGGNILCCKVVTSEKFALFGGKGVEVNIWDLDNCTKIWNAKSPTKNSLGIFTPTWFTSATFLSKDDHKKFVAGTNSHQVRLYDISAQRRPVLSFDFRETPIKALAADIDGYSVYIGNGSGDMASFDIRTGKKIFAKSNLELSDANSSREGQDVKVSSGVMVATVPTGEFVLKMHSLEDGPANPPEMKKTSDPDYVQEKEHVVNVMENANETNHSSVSKKEFNVHHRFSPRLAGTEPVQLANNVIKEQTLQVPKRNLRKSRTTLDADMENTSPQHFNGVPKIENVHKIQEVINASLNLSEDQSVFKEQPHLLEADKAEDNKPEIRTKSNKSSNKRVHHIPRRASKRLAGIEHELMNNSISCDKAPNNKSKMSKDEVNAEFQKSEVGPAAELADHAPIKVESANKRRKSLDDQLEIVEDEEMNDEKSEPQLSFAFHYSWSDPSLEYAINTLTGVLSDKDSVDNGPTTGLETDVPKTPFDNVTIRRDRNPSLEFATNTLTGVLLAEDSVDNGPTATLGTDTQKTSFDNVTGSRERKPQIRSNKSKNKKELTVPIRLSKRLAGLEPEVRPSERAIEYVSRKSCKEEPIATLTATLTSGASDHLDAGEETKPRPHASDRSKTELVGESSNKSEKSYDAQTVPNKQLQKVEPENIGDERSEQLQKVKDENIGDERSEPQLPLLFGDPWSDPCLEFAIKTLTGALPVDAPTEFLPGRAPDINNLSNKGLHECVVTSINEEPNDNSNLSQNKKELDMVSQPSTLFLGQPELRTSSTTCENAPTFTTKEFFNNEGNITRNLVGETLHTEAGNVTQLVHHSRNISTPIHEGLLKENEKILELENITMGQPPLETKDHDNTESQFCSSFMDSWSDSCLEFAFKTLTGAIPVDENLFQGCFPEPANCHDQSDGGSTLSHFGSTSFSQSDISFYHDIGVESRAGQQSSTSSSFLPLEKSNLQGFPGVDPQKHYSQTPGKLR